MLVGGGRLAQKALHDVLKLSGRAPAQSWGPEQWFVSTAGGTLRVCGVEEVDGERSCLRLPGHKSPEAGCRGGLWCSDPAPGGPRGPQPPLSAQAPHPGSVSSCVLATSSSLLRQDKDLPVFFFPGFLLRQALWGAAVAALPPEAPTCLGLSAPFLPAGPSAAPFSF